MYVIKRNGNLEIISFDKILKRINKIRDIDNDKLLNVNTTQLAIKIIDQLYDKITTTKIDELTSEICASMTSTHPEYNILAGRIAISNHHKNTSSKFTNVMFNLYNYIDNNYNHHPLVSSKIKDICIKYENELNDILDYSRDYLIDYFGFKTLEKSYLMRINKIVVERPQHLWLRVAIEIHSDNLDKIKETYKYMSLKYFTHATPTLYNSGTPKPQLSSCFLLAMEDDSIDGIYNTLKECALISKHAGGIGLHIHNIRASGSHIRGTNGTSNGIVPMLRVFNNTAKYVDQGGGKRNGSFAIYLEPWHADIELFLQMRKNHGDEELKARDLFYGLWIPDLFMERVNDDLDWTLMCPDECPGLSDVYHIDFNNLYIKYEKENRGRKTIKARNLWFQILDSQMETGTPYLLYKDSCNLKSNQKNLGTIKSSNLCTEIIEYSDKNETAVCNLASIALPAFVENGIFNFEKLYEITKIITCNLDKVIDVNYYPTEKTKISNMKNRPIGIGVQGLADVFMLLDLSFTCEEAKKLNIEIFETMYHAALTSSMELSKLFGPYETFKGSPASFGELQFDLWKKYTKKNDFNIKFSGKYNWDDLKQKIINHGIRNSLLIAPMPTASTSQILGYTECIEPITSNIYNRRTMAGEFMIVNKYLIKDLIKLNMWNDKIKNNIILNNGSIQQIDLIPNHIKEKYKTLWEIPMRNIIDMSLDRSVFICQSTSLNLWQENPNYNTLTSMHFYSWKNGLKTGIYYLRRRAKHEAQKFTIEPELKNNNKQIFEDEEVCEMCSS